MANTPGFKALEEIAKNKIDTLTKSLVKPSPKPSERNINDVIDVQSTIKGINWLFEQVEAIKKKQS